MALKVLKTNKQGRKGNFKVDPRGQEVEFIPKESKEMEALLQAGYQMSIEDAKLIIKTHEANPAVVTMEDYKAAKAMLAAYTENARAISETPGWKRELAKR